MLNKARDQNGEERMRARARMHVCVCVCVCASVVLHRHPKEVQQNGLEFTMAYRYKNLGGVFWLPS
jgi:hypothetical protein